MTVVTEQRYQQIRRAVAHGRLERLVEQADRSDAMRFETVEALFAYMEGPQPSDDERSHHRPPDDRENG